jgi:glycerol uptake facilitator-like aquaporin
MDQKQAGNHGWAGNLTKTTENSKLAGMVCHSANGLELHSIQGFRNELFPYAVLDAYLVVLLNQSTLSLNPSFTPLISHAS